jgi:hypothetical protein
MSDNNHVSKPYSRTDYEMSSPRMINLALPDRCLAVFVDDTGHEDLVDGQPVYGLGGCAVLSRDLDRIVRAPWRDVRRQVTGSPDTPLHASKFSPLATPENIESVARFFREQPFARIGAIISTDTMLTDELGRVSTIAKVLQLRIVEIARWTICDSVAVIFGSSERADRLIEEASKASASKKMKNRFRLNVISWRRSKANLRSKLRISSCMPWAGKHAAISRCGAISYWFPSGVSRG